MFCLFLILCLLISSAVALPIAFLGQLAFYGLAAAGALLRNRKIGRARVFTVPYFFTFVNAAALLGILSMLKGKRTAAWSTRPPATKPLDGSAESLAQRRRLG